MLNMDLAKFHKFNLSNCSYEKRKTHIEKYEIDLFKLWHPVENITCI